jgi:tRNA pseudouridine55 synthase
MDGLLVIDKPAGPSSHAIVLRVRRLLNEPRVGHTGTLDPAASGVLPLVLGRATRLARFLAASRKTYEALLQLGIATTTYDAQGKPVGSRYSGPLPDRDTIDRALGAFRGTFMQKPPIYSAKKVGGHRSYEIARRVAETDDRQPAVPLPQPVQVTAHKIDIDGIDADRVTLSVECSPGFYVRSLAHDLGAELGTGAHLLNLRRTRAGDLTLQGAVTLEALEDPATRRAVTDKAFVPLSQMLTTFPTVVLTPDGVRRAVHGRELRGEDAESGLAVFEEARLVSSESEAIRLMSPDGELVGIASRRNEPGVLHPLVVLM